MTSEECGELLHNYGISRGWNENGGYRLNLNVGNKVLAVFAKDKPQANRRMLDNMEWWLRQIVEEIEDELNT